MEFFKKLFGELAGFKSLSEAVSKNISPVSVTGLSHIHRAQLIYALGGKKINLVITGSEAEAKKLCDVLVVGVNSDDSVRRHKGPTRPIQDETTRATLLASLECVDYVVVFDDDVPVALVKAVRPDVIAKEGYPLSKWPEGRLVKRLGGEAVRLNRLEGHSTTELVKRMNAGGRQ